MSTVELAEYKIGLASANFARAGLASCISVVHDDAAACSNARLRALSILSSLIPSVRSIQDGGRISDACYGLAACSWLTTQYLTARRWRRL